MERRMRSLSSWQIRWQERKGARRPRRTLFLQVEPSREPYHIQYVQYLIVNAWADATFSRGMGF